MLPFEEFGLDVKGKRRAFPWLNYWLPNLTRIGEKGVGQVWQTKFFLDWWAWIGQPT